MIIVLIALGLFAIAKKGISKVKLSKNFSLGEFLVTNTGIINTIDPSYYAKVYNNIKRLTTNTLQPIRDKFGVVKITSGYRSKGVNDAVGGAKNSQHRIGQAADFVVPGKNLFDIFKEIVSSNIPYDQIIYETNKQGNSWIHISFNSLSKNRDQALTATYDKVSNSMKFNQYK